MYVRASETIACNTSTGSEPKANHPCNGVVSGSRPKWLSQDATEFVLLRLLRG
jgi:hypothetical protein